jgi:hypothetical protein
MNRTYKRDIDANELREMMSYDPSNGRFTWLVDHDTQKAGDGATMTNGQVTVVQNEAGNVVAVTRTDDEHRILEVIWERTAPPVAAAPCNICEQAVTANGCACPPAIAAAPVVDESGDNRPKRQRDLTPNQRMTSEQFDAGLAALATNEGKGGGETIERFLIHALLLHMTIDCEDNDAWAHWKGERRSIKAMAKEYLGGVE